MPPTSAAQANHLVTGRLLEASPDRIVLGIPHSDYRLHLVPAAPINARPKDRISGAVRAQALRVDVVPSGGRYIEPVFGRPRRIQGRIIGGDPAQNTLIVDAACPIHCRLNPRQKTADFALGQLVSFDVERGASFTPQA